MGLNFAQRGHVPKPLRNLFCLCLGIFCVFSGLVAETKLPSVANPELPLHDVTTERPTDGACIPGRNGCVFKHRIRGL